MGKSERASRLQDGCVCQSAQTLLSHRPGQAAPFTRDCWDGFFLSDAEFNETKAKGGRAPWHVLAFNISMSRRICGGKISYNSGKLSCMFHRKRITVIDLKDYFYSIPIYSDDSKCFAFFCPPLKKSFPIPLSLDSIISKNYLTVCQHFVDWILGLGRRDSPEVHNC